MTHINNFLLCSLYLFLANNSFCQKTLYHKCEKDDPGEFHIIQWDIPHKSLPEFYIKEIIDKKGRVKELKFLSHNSIKYSVECGIYKWVKFEYPNDTTIVELYLTSRGKCFSDFECGEPCQATYYLSKDQNKILDWKFSYVVDTSYYLKHGMKLEEIHNAIIGLTMEQIEIDCLYYYSKSKAKLHGKFPISSKFALNADSFGVHETDEIKKALIME